MKIEKKVITPDYAAKLLEKNNMNRPVKSARVAQYARDMKNGKWFAETGETVKISSDGTIIDGQHRLLAIKQAGVSVEIYIASGLNTEIFPVIDTGVRRTGKDAFHIGNIKNSAYASAVINKFISIKAGSISYRSKEAITNSEALELYNASPKQWDGIIENTMRWYRIFNRIASPAFIGGWYAFFFDIDQDKSFEFFEQLCSGEGLTNPTVNVLRNTFIKDKVSQSKLPENKKAAFLLKTWNCFRKGTTLQSLRYDTVNEEMPLAI